MLILVSCGILMGMLIGFCLFLPDLLQIMAVIAVAINLAYGLIKKGLFFIYQKYLSHDTTCHMAKV